MAVDVITRITIDRPRSEVSAWAGDPDNAPAWYVNIKEVTWKTPPPLAEGSLVTFVARFMGRRLEYTYRITELQPGKRMVMKTSEGPFPMETTYGWEDAAGGGTVMTLENRGEPRGFSRLAAPFMARAMRSANEKDLQRLKTIMER